MLARETAAMRACLLVALCVVPHQARALDPGLQGIRLRGMVAEAKVNLKEAWMCEKMYFSHQREYTSNVEALSYAPERQNRYNYYLSPSGSVQPRTRHDNGSKPDDVIISADRFAYQHARLYPTVADTHCPITPGAFSDGTEFGVGVSHHGTRQEFLLLAAANLADDDKAPLDCWTIASVNRQTHDGRRIPAGEPLHEQRGYDDALSGPYDKVLTDFRVFDSRVRDLHLHAGTPLPGSMDEFARLLDKRELIPRQDPWGSPYLVLRTSDALIFVSFGADKKVETEDDVVDIQKVHLMP